MDIYVSKLLGRLNIELNRQDKSGVYGLTQRLLAYNSNKIEGSTLTYNQTSSIFETGYLNTEEDITIRTKDVEEMTGHFIMFNNMLKSYNNNLSEELIKKYHYDLKSGVFEDIANGYPIGEYKSRANIVSDILTMSPTDVSKEINNLILEYNKKNEATLEDIALFHVRYEMIHPFQDGNGRTGRIIMYKECLKNNIFPFIIEDTRKHEYYQFLNVAQKTNDINPLVQFFREEQEIYFNLVKDFIC